MSGQPEKLPSYGSRFVLFSDNIAVSTFQVSLSSKGASGEPLIPLVPEGPGKGMYGSAKTYVHIFLSPTGHQVQIVLGDVVSTHLTCFVPSKFRTQVRMLVNWRNSYVSPPFLTPLLHGTDPYLGQNGHTWCCDGNNLSIPAAVATTVTAFNDATSMCATAAVWAGASLADVRQSATIVVCPTGRRVSMTYEAPYTAHPTSANSRAHDTSSVALHDTFGATVTVMCPVNSLDPNGAVSAVLRSNCHIAASRNDSVAYVHTELGTDTDGKSKHKGSHGYTAAAFSELRSLTHWLQRGDLGSASNIPHYSGGVVVVEHSARTTILLSNRGGTANGDVDAEAWLDDGGVVWLDGQEVCYSHGGAAHCHSDCASKKNVFQASCVNTCAPQTMKSYSSNDNTDNSRVSGVDRFHLALFDAHNLHGQLPTDANHDTFKAPTVHTTAIATRLSHVVARLLAHRARLRDLGKAVYKSMSFFQRSLGMAMAPSRMLLEQGIDAGPGTSTTTTTDVGRVLSLPGALLQQLPNGHYYGRFADNILLTLMPEVAASPTATHALQHHCVSTITTLSDNSTVRCILPDGHTAVYTVRQCHLVSMCTPSSTQPAGHTQSLQPTDPTEVPYTVALHVRALVNFFHECTRPPKQQAEFRAAVQNGIPIHIPKRYPNSTSTHIPSPNPNRYLPARHISKAQALSCQRAMVLSLDRDARSARMDTVYTKSTALATHLESDQYGNTCATYCSSSSSISSRNGYNIMNNTQERDMAVSNTPDTNLDTSITSLVSPLSTAMSTPAAAVPTSVPAKELAAARLVLAVDQGRQAVARSNEWLRAVHEGHRVGVEIGAS